MSQQSLASKKITRRNVAQSSVVFSVVVAVITLGVIATVAYVDITEEIDSVTSEKSIPERIAAQKLRAEENRKQAELKLQAHELVVNMDKRVDDLNQKIQNANKQLNFVTTKLEAKAPEQNKPVITTVKAVLSQNNTTLTQQDALKAQHYIQSVFNQNHAAKVSFSQQGTADGDVFFDVSWLFKARGDMGIKQDFSFNAQGNSQNNWNAKTF